MKVSFIKSSNADIPFLTVGKFKCCGKSSILGETERIPYYTASYLFDHGMVMHPKSV